MLQARNAIEIERVKYQRHSPENTLLYQLVERYYPKFGLLLSAQETPCLIMFIYIVNQHNILSRQASTYIINYLGVCRSARVERGPTICCHHERLVAFSCKTRGFCPSCGARRMAQIIKPPIIFKRLTCGVIDFDKEATYVAY